MELGREVSYIGAGDCAAKLSAVSVEMEAQERGVRVLRGKIREIRVNQKW